MRDRGDDRPLGPVRRPDHSPDHTADHSPDRPAGPDVELRAALAVLSGADVARCSWGELDVLRGACQRLRGFVAAVDVRIARRTQELSASCGIGTGPDRPPEHTAGAGGGDGAGDRDGAGADGAPGAGPPGGPGEGDELPGGAGLGGPGLGGPGAGEASSFGGTTGRRSDAESERDGDRSRAVAALPSFEAALEAGRIDVGHVDALVAALGRIDDDAVRARFTDCERELLGYAGVESPERFRRRCQDLARRLSREHGIETAARQKRAARTRQWWDRRTGMFHLHLEVEPELGARIETAIDDHLAVVRDRDSGEPWERLRVEAITELIVHSGALDLRAPEVSVLIDWESLRAGVLAAGGVCESDGAGELAPETVRRLACDAGIVPVVLGGDGVPLDHGRTRRLASREQRRALRAMYRTCAHPGCTRPFTWCRMHHVVFWERLGGSDLENLIPLCDRHHHLVHEGGWTLTMTPDRVCTWTTPSGRVWFHGDPRDALGPDHPSRARSVTADGAGDAAAGGPVGVGRRSATGGTIAGPEQDGGRRPPCDAVAVRAGSEGDGADLVGADLVGADTVRSARSARRRGHRGGDRDDARDGDRDDARDDAPDGDRDDDRDDAPGRRP